ncbi:MAG: TetR/AcrR family transcriptional regulator [Clostridium luticellarii]|jgi:AcrR family transcriptional regulator|uniref:TetR family regulatory protein n=1 Tax=Clostridium luticellarii TaxID=1691940 RepID=A0A2T0BPN5_9CLOT|nr:TetR/AcrR family transcriptional regulator [Clostridium luticellarii]MCI1996889.1 TetR/AcrR family transcriptional regulator [Clostridium luticellarii]MCI2041334.1 TetR/AcrR family transcriptional regulator [Clostridium luticellarii]PRR85856.1 tetR family regulatory protein [Clostridium luticellarii]
MDKQKKGTRRRGEVLEEAILQAAWEELSETGYTHMTMESIATRAGTNKSVLYRRWSDKSELVIAALRKYYFPKIKNEIPDTGNLRNDVYAYLHARVEPLKTIGTETIRGLIMEPVIWRRIIASIPQIIERRSHNKHNKMEAAITAILKNAELRGEVCLEKLSPRIISLPLDLLQYELIKKLEPVSDEAIAEIVDDIFMPLIHSIQ